MSKILTGVLSKNSKTCYLKTKDNNKILLDGEIWEGYLIHWKNKVVNARPLPQKDYKTGKNIYVLWLFNEKKDNIPFLELYYNERLIKYPASTFGHNAINVSGKIYNFSHYMNENEVLTPEEYFFRPALGEFSPSPVTKRFALNQNGKNYFDKFGRNFMRKIHVLRVEGINDKYLFEIFDEELNNINNSEPHPNNQELYKDFNFFYRSCTTIIRDCLKRYGFNNIKGIFPRDFFINTAFECSKLKYLKIRMFTLPQLQVSEAPPSKPTPFINPLNYYRFKKLIKSYK